MNDTPPAPESVDDGATATGDADPADDLAQGLKLLWRAARGAAREIQREVEGGEVSEALRNAGRELDAAANAAAKTVERLVDKLNVPEPTYSDGFGGADDAGASDDAGVEASDQDADASDGSSG